MMIDDPKKIWNIILILVGVIFILWAIYIIVSLIFSYNKEKEKAKKSLKKEKSVKKLTNVNQFDDNQQNLQMAYAGGTNGVTQVDTSENGFYASAVEHFTDTGRSKARTGYFSDDYDGEIYNNMNFVIVKSVIATETREEID